MAEKENVTARDRVVKSVNDNFVKGGAVSAERLSWTVDCHIRTVQKILKTLCDNSPLTLDSKKSIEGVEYYKSPKFDVRVYKSNGLREYTFKRKISKADVLPRV
jgi:hypothetical protein